MTCHHRFWTTHPVERCRTWHAINAFGQHTRLIDVERGLTSPPLDSTHGRTTSDVKCHHRFSTAHTVEGRRAWHADIAFGKQSRSNNVERGMPTSLLGSTNSRTTSGVACHNRLWASQTVERRWAWHEITFLELHAQSDDVARGMTSPPLDCKDVQTTLGVT